VASVFPVAWVIYRIHTQTGINPLDLYKGWKRERGGVMKGEKKDHL